MDIHVLEKNVKNPEGPVSLPDHSWVFTEMDIGAITHMTADGHRRCIAVTGLPNGLAVGADGRIWVAEAKQRALLAVSLDGVAETVSTGGEAPFLLPNDLCFGPDGMIYMTDSGILHSEMQKAKGPMGAYDLPYDGRLYVIHPKTGDSRILDRGFRLTNGIAFSPDGEYLYLAETLSGEIFRYRTGVWEREPFGNVLKNSPRSYGRVAGPDGMACDVEGNLYVAVIAQDLTVLAPDGKVLRRIELQGDNPTNLAFDINEPTRLLVTESSRGELLMLDVPTAGAPLFTDQIQ